MKKHARDNLARYFFDASKLSLAMLVFGVIGRQPFSGLNLAAGIILTLLLAGFGASIDLVPIEKED